MKIAIVAAMKEELFPFEEHFSPGNVIFSKGPIRILEVHEKRMLPRLVLGYAIKSILISSLTPGQQEALIMN